jgi:phosphoserine phosphatase
MRAAILVVVFDFDDTLVPDSTTKLLRSRGIDADKFWSETRDLVARGYDPAPAYLKLLLDNVAEGKPLAGLTNEKLKEFGASLDSEFFPGIPEVFTDLRSEVARFRDIGIEFYINSGGLKPIIEGSKIVQEHFAGVYACELESDTESGVLNHIKRCVTFTEKTRYLFEINKGLDPKETYGKPHLVNRLVPENTRRVPFQNMIYIGDGMTDIPCFSLVGKGTHAEKGGKAVGVFDPRKRDKAKDILRMFLNEGRVTGGPYSPKYREEDDLGNWLRGVVTTRCSDITLERKSALGSEEE